MKLFEVSTRNKKTLEESVFYVLAANTTAAIKKLHTEAPDEVEEMVGIIATTSNSDVYDKLIHKV